MNLNSPHLQKVRRNVGDTVFHEGYNLFVNRRISAIYEEGNDLTAKVKDERTYTVNMSLRDGTYTQTCTCSKRSEICEHVMAVLFYVYDKTKPRDVSNYTYEELDDKYLSRRADAYDPAGYKGSLFGDVEKDEDRDIIESLMYSIGDFNKKPPKVLTEIDAKTPPARKCKIFLDYLYEGSKGKSGKIPNKSRVPFHTIGTLATQYESRGQPKKVIDVYQCMCEYISNNIAIVNDAKQHYTKQFQHSIRQALESIRKTKASDDEKRHYAKYYFTAYINERTPRFAHMYLSAIYDISKDTEYTKYCMSLFVSEFEDKKKVGVKNTRRSKDELLDAIWPLLERLGDKQVNDFLVKHHMESDDMCVRHIWNLADSNPDQAMDVAKKAMQTFADPERFIRIQSFLLEANDNSEHEDLLRQRFVRTTNWSHYEMLKEKATDWDVQLKKILKDLTDDNCTHTCIDILLREKGADEAFKAAIDSKDLDILDAYKYEFSSKYPDKYYTEYKRLVPKLAASANTAQDFEDILRHIEVMKHIPGYVTETDKLVAKLEYKYPQLAEQMESIPIHDK